MRSRPVRVGNAARGQLQLDVYGEVMDAVAQFAFHILKPGERFDRTTQRVLIEMGKYVSRNWRRPDEGLWEPRTGRRNHTHSRALLDGAGPAMQTRRLRDTGTRSYRTFR